MIWGAARGRARVDAADAAYTQRRSERAAVRAAYRVWSAAGAFGEPASWMPQSCRCRFLRLEFA